MHIEQLPSKSFENYNTLTGPFLFFWCSAMFYFLKHHLLTQNDLSKSNDFQLHICEQIKMHFYMLTSLIRVEIMNLCPTSCDDTSCKDLIKNIFNNEKLADAGAERSILLSVSSVSLLDFLSAINIWYRLQDMLVQDNNVMHEGDSRVCSNIIQELFVINLLQESLFVCFVLYFAFTPSCHNVRN